MSPVRKNKLPKGMFLPETYPKYPIMVRCNICKNLVETALIPVPSSRTHVTALLLALLCLFPCMCIPYCTSSSKDMEHHCPVCNTYFGTYFRPW